MRDIVLAVINALKADTNIATAVGSRVYRARLEMGGTLPAIVVSRVDAIRPNDTNVDYIVSRIQVTTYSTNDGEADDISEMTANTLNRLVNQMLGGVIIVGIFDAGMLSDNNPEIGLWMYHRDFMVTYQ